MLQENNDYRFTLVEEEAKTRMVAMGIGGMGGNAMENLAATGIHGLEIYSINTDMQALGRCVGSRPVQIGSQRTAGKGAGGDSETGRLSAEDDMDLLRELIAGAELVFIAAGMGGGTGTGGAPVIAGICRELGILTVGMVTTPMACEGEKRLKKAQRGLADLRNQVDSLVVIENEKLSLVMDSGDVSIIEVFRRADNVLVDGIAAINRMINSHGYINLDLADLRNVLGRPSENDCADALITVGVAEGENRAAIAAALVMENPLLANGDIKGATNLLINVAANENMGLSEAHNVVQAITDQAGDGEREIFMGIVTDNSLGDRISVTLIATGSRFNKRDAITRFEIVSENHGAEIEPVEVNSGLYPFPDRREKDGAGRLTSGSAYLHKQFGAAEMENFGASPLVAHDEWQFPAYSRRQCRYSDRDASPAHGRTAEEAGIREEINALKRTRGKKAGIYREPALRMAC
ncbi:MAG: cell division protein FtsZ, partial [Desulfobulbales bacterium]|nr:cell division protein FtsZ [Desulfobulbales bacterium]